MQDKQVIGMVHFSPLEGDPNFPGKETVLHRAEEDLSALVEGGVDAVLFENNFDNPKFETLPKEQACHFSELVEKLTQKLSLPWGISALWNDYELGFRLCRDHGGEMVRVPVFVDSVETVYGTFLADPARVLRLRSECGADEVKILADVQVKHAKMLHPRLLSESVCEAVDAGADTIVITGTWTGDPPTLERIREARCAVGEKKLYVGSGMTAENINDFLPYIDGCIVGTAFKAMRGTNADGPNVVGQGVRYDQEHIRGFMNAVRGR